MEARRTEERATSLDIWMQRGEYLPDCMQDFHDTKDLFKTMHEIVNVQGHEYAKGVDWITGQNYVVDIFLWFMARRGYTLQRSRQKHEFRDLEADIAAVKQRSQQAFSQILGDALAKSKAPSHD